VAKQAVTIYLKFTQLPPNSRLSYEGVHIPNVMFWNSVSVLLTFSMSDAEFSQPETFYALERL
jgi:hypothetical protein